MDKSKTLFRILTLIILFIPTMLAFYNIYVITSDKPTPENTTKITALRGDGMSEEYTDRNDISLLIKTLEKASDVKPNRNLDEETPLILTLHKGSDELEYSLYLSLNSGECFLKTYNNELKLLDKKDAELLLNEPIADMIFPYSQIPIAGMSQGDDMDSLKILPSSGDWFIQKPNGEFYPSTVGNILAETNKAKISVTRPFNLQFSVEPDLVNLAIEYDKETVFDGNYDDYPVFENDFLYNSPPEIVRKNMNYKVTAEWHRDDDSGYYGTAEYNINVLYDVPSVFVFSETEPKPGDIVIVTAYNIYEDDNFVLEITDEDTDYSTQFMTVDGKQIALIPISLEYAGRTLGVSLTSSDESHQFELAVSINSAAPAAISADPNRMEIHLSDSAVLEKQAAYDKIMAMPSPAGERYWDGRFVLPREGREWLSYGSRVNINGTNHSYVNLAINIDINPGNPIVASNSGKVIFAELVPEDGNLVVIDHGMGIKTWYGHMTALKVAVGDEVVKNQEIGVMGTNSNDFTGLYTSVKFNVHFAVSVNDIFVNPSWLIKNGIEGGENPSALIIPGFESENLGSSNSSNSSDSLDIPEISNDADNANDAGGAANAGGEGDIPSAVSDETEP